MEIRPGDLVFSGKRKRKDIGWVVDVKHGEILKCVVKFGFGKKAKTKTIPVDKLTIPMVTQTMVENRERFIRMTHIGPSGERVWTETGKSVGGDDYPRGFGET